MQELGSAGAFVVLEGAATPVSLVVVESPTAVLVTGVEVTGKLTSLVDVVVSGAVAESCACTASMNTATMAYLNIFMGA
jgi:hypothetical protein